MAYITENYDNSKIIGELLRLRPEIKLGNPQVRVGDVEVPPPSSARSHTISVTLNFSLSDDEWREVLDNSRIG